MKLWQQTLAFITGLSMLFPLVACGSGNDSSSSDSSSYSSSEESSSSEYLTEQKQQIAQQVITSITQEISQAKTVSLSAEGSLQIHSKIWEEQDRDEIKQGDFSSNASFEINAVLSQTNNGSYNAKVEGSCRWSTSLRQETFLDVGSMYLINGYVFISQEDNVYTKSPLLPEYTVDSIEETVLAIEEALGLVLKDVQLPSIDTSALLSSVVDLATETFSFDSHSLTLEYDFVPAIDAVKDFVGEFNPKHSIERALNNILAHIDETLTVDSILDEIENLAKVNAQTALNEIDAWLTEEYETTLQGVWDTVTASQKFIDLFTYTADESGMDAEDITDWLNNLQSFKLADLLSQIDGFESMTLYDLLIGSMFQDVSDAPTVEEIRGLLQEYLDMKLEQVIPAQAFDIVKNFNANALSNTTKLSFDSSYTITEFFNGLVFDLSATLPSGYDGLSDWVSASASLSQTYSLSSLAVPISLPNGITIINP